MAPARGPLVRTPYPQPFPSFPVPFWTLGVVTCADLEGRTGPREVASPRGRWGNRSARVELSSDVMSGAGGELRAQRGM